MLARRTVEKKFPTGCNYLKKLSHQYEYTILTQKPENIPQNLKIIPTNQKTRKKHVKIRKKCNSAELLAWPWNPAGATWRISYRHGCGAVAAIECSDEKKKSNSK